MEQENIAQRDEFWGYTPWLPQRGWQAEHIWNPSEDEEEEEELPWEDD